MRVLSATQIRQADAYTIEHEPIASIDLMERAAIACCDWITSKVSIGQNIVVVCGPGNNGGDGLAISRLLKEKWYSVTVFVLRIGNYSTDFVINLDRLQEESVPLVVFDEYDDTVSFAEYDIVIDALFGTGLSRPVTGWVAEWIQNINSSGKPIIAIDVPSGLNPDIHSEGAIVKANHTLVFESPRFAFFFAENHPYVGTFHVLRIGLDRQYMSDIVTENFTIESGSIRSLLKSRDQFAHKGSFGHAFLVAGSKGKIGAAVLAANGCLRSGSGLLTLHVPGCGYQVVQISVPEAIADVDTAENSISKFNIPDKVSAIALGPGIGQEIETEKAILSFLQNANSPVILDADALNILGNNKSYFKYIPANSILTPHPKEFERIGGKTSNDFERHQRQLALSIKFKIYIILKGAYTCITTPDGNSFFNTTGNPGMAKGGSGDVLTGILLGLLAQKYSCEEVCKLGVYLHGLAGDLAAKKYGEHSMLPTDLINSIPEAFLDLSFSS